MVVFLYALLLIFIIIFCMLIILTLSSLEIDVKDITIENSKNAYNILEILLKEKNDEKKLDVLDNIKCNIKLKIKFMKKIPIISVKIDNMKIKELLLKQYRYEIKKNKDIQKDKEKAKNIIKKIMPQIYLKVSSLNLKLGTDDAALTAIASSVISIIISILLPYISDHNKLQNYYYRITPIYINKNVFFLQFSCIRTIKLVHIINVICKKEEKVK